MIDSSIANNVCMRSHNFGMMGEIMAICKEEVTPSDDEMSRSDDHDHGNDGFNFCDFVKGFCAQKVCTFERLGWLQDSGEVDVSCRDQVRFLVWPFLRLSSFLARCSSCFHENHPPGYRL